MQESVTFEANIHKTCIEPWHEFLHLGNINIAHREVCRARFVLVFNQSFILKQGNGNLFWLYVNDYFACHFSLFIIGNTLLFPLLLFIEKGARHVRHAPFLEQSLGLTCSYDGSYVISFYAYA